MDKRDHTFQEVVKQWTRYCKKAVLCRECKLYNICKTDPESVTEENWQFIEREVMEWAEQNPEPQYPTWIEWLSKQGFVELKNGQFVRQTESEYLYECKTVAVLTDKAAVTIPAETAQKLGLQPKED